MSIWSLFFRETLWCHVTTILSYLQIFAPRTVAESLLVAGSMINVECVEAMEAAAK